MPLYLDGPVIRRGEALEDFETPFRTYLGAKYRDAIDNNVTPLLAENERVNGEFRPPMLDPGDPTAGIAPTYGEGPVKLDAETARAKVKEANVRLDVPDDGIPQGALDILIARQKRRKAYDDAIARSPTGARSVAGFGVSFLGALLDPLNVASAFVPVVGEARYSLMLARASGAMGRAGVRAGVGAMEGLAGAAMLEPFAYGAHQGLQDDYKALDSVVNIGFGGVLGGGLHVAGGAVRDVLQLGRWRTPERARAHVEASTRAASAHAAAGVPPTADAPTVADAIDAVEAPAGPTPPVNGFVTAKGSTYEITERGTTIRDKAPRPEHPGDSGPQPESERTFYVTPEDAQKLGEFQTQGGASSVVDMLPDGRAGVRYVEGKDSGKFEGRTVVPTSAHPSVGFIPVETWKGGATVHFGNPITEVRAVRPDAAAAVAARADHVQRETALRTAVAQSVDGRTVDVEPIFNADATIKPGADRLSDPEGAQQSVERVKAAPQTLDLKVAEADLAEAMQDLEARWAATGRDPAALKALDPELDAMTKQADELARAARAAGLCDVG